MENVLITGGTGLVGQRLTKMLQESGQYKVFHLSRTKSTKTQPITYQWKPEEGSMEREAIRKADYVIHLAGAGIADKPWTAERKQEIRDSRVETAKLLAQYIGQYNTKLKAFVSASAVGYYGMDRGQETLTEEAEPGQDFLAEICQEWEEAARQVAAHGVPTRILRIGVVLSARGGALQQIDKPIRWMVGAPLGSGRQYMSWIHIDDLCRAFRFLMENPLEKQFFNGTAPNPQTNRQLTKAVAKALGRPLFLPNVPPFIIRSMMGRMAEMVLGGTYVLPQNLQEAGFEFRYPELKEALEAVYG